MGDKLYVYRFDEADPTDVNLFGGKGAGLAEMAQEDLPIPHGFIITTQACKDYFNGSLDTDALNDQVMEAIQGLQELTGRCFGDDLLVSVRSGAPISMPGQMNTVLNLGATAATEAPFTDSLHTNSRLFLEIWKEFLCQFGKTACGLPNSQRLNQPEKMYRQAHHISDSTSFTDTQYRELVSLVYHRIAREGHEAVLSNPYNALHRAITTVFNSWNGSNAKAWRKHHGISDDLGTAVNVVSMVYGNLNQQSGTGVLFSRNPATGAKELYGEYLPAAQGEAVVSGTVTPEPLSSLQKSQKTLYDQLEKYAELLERKHQAVQDIEFTIENGKLYLLQRRTAKLTDQAALIVAVDMVVEGLISDQEAATRISSKQLKKLNQPQVDSKGLKPVATGLAASPGVVSGRAIMNDATFDSFNAGPLILVREFTSPDDVPHLLDVRCMGILTSTGGITSHAAVVARGMNKPCVVGCAALEISENTIHIIGEFDIHNGDWITINGATGEVFPGKLDLVESSQEDNPAFKLMKTWQGWYAPGVEEPDQQFEIGLVPVRVLSTDQTASVLKETRWWKELDLNLNLEQAIADFYLLNNAVVEHPTLSSVYEDYAEVLAKPLAVYLDAAVGGEARHCHGGFMGMHGGPRSLARAAWLKIRRKEGISSLLQLRDAFNIQSNWGGAFGGPKWGKATDVLYRFLKAEIPAGVFIDLAFDLEHNNGCIFNKIASKGIKCPGGYIDAGWQMSATKTLLDLKFSGSFDQLRTHASPSMLLLLDNFNGGDASQVTVRGAAEAKGSLKTHVVSKKGDINVGDVVSVKTTAKATYLHGVVGEVIMTNLHKNQQYAKVLFLIGEGYFPTKKRAWLSFNNLTVAIAAENPTIAVNTASFRQYI